MQVDRTLLAVWLAPETLWLCFKVLGYIIILMLVATFYYFATRKSRMQWKWAKMIGKCSNCGYAVQANKPDSTARCPECGLEMPSE